MITSPSVIIAPRKHCNLLGVNNTSINLLYIGVRANIHLGGADRVLPEWIRWGGGGSSRNFPGSIFCGGGGSSRNFPGSIFCGVPEFFQLTPVTDTKFGFFKHGLCFARIILTLCPNSCRQTARIGGQLPPVPYAYATIIYNDVHSLPLPVGLCTTMYVGTPPPYFDTTVGLQPQLACGLIWELFEPSQLLGGGGV